MKTDTHEPRRLVSAARPTGEDGCWKCSRAGAHECGRTDCGNRIVLTADVSDGAKVLDYAGSCYAMPPHLF